MSLLEKLLRKLLPHKEIGWREIGEKFTRYTLAKTRWFNIYLHQLDAPVSSGKCHDHPWSFFTVLLRGGYWEYVTDRWIWRRPGSLLYRPATFRHNVVTKGTSWSLVFTSGKFREWGFMDECRVPVKG